MIVNVLRDGTIKKDMTGHVVKYEDAKALYDRLLREGRNHADHKQPEPADTVRRCGQ